MSPPYAYDDVFAVWAWQFSNTGSFNNMLLDLVAKADFTRRHLLAKGFPGIVAAYEAWCLSGDYGNELFRAWKIPLEGESNFQKQLKE